MTAWRTGGIRRDWRVWAGLALGAGLALAIGPIVRQGDLDCPAGPMLPDCEGKISELVIQYTSASEPVVGEALRQFLSAIDPGVLVHVVTPDDGQAGDFRRRVASAAKCRFHYVPAGRDITAWSRDRWIACAPAEKGGARVLVAPRAELGGEIWPARKGDSAVADVLAGASGGRIKAVRHGLEFDGGDFVADGKTVFVSPQVIRRNLGKGSDSVEEIACEMERLTGRKAVMLEGGPFHHAGMFMMTAGNGRVLVGDPAMADRIMREAGEGVPDGMTADLSGPAQAAFDAVAAACAAAGYEVLRIPLLPSTDGRIYVTYVNVVLDIGAGGERRVYMPVYGTNPALNKAAGEVWRAAGYEVTPVDCTAVFRCSGSLRCLVNVAARG